MFEFDINKSLSNKEKHGIDFDEAQALWDNNNAYEFKTQYLEEERFIVIGQVKNKYWTAVITYRNNNIRIISVRRSREKEIESYENYYS